MKAMWLSAGMLLKKEVRASRPPADAPMPTMGKASDEEGILACSSEAGFRGAGFLFFASGGMPAFVARTGFEVSGLPFFAAVF
jgi:hypothetical protein